MTFHELVKGTNLDWAASATSCPLVAAILREDASRSGSISLSLHLSLSLPPSLPPSLSLHPPSSLSISLFLHLGAIDGMPVEGA